MTASNLVQQKFSVEPFFNPIKENVKREILAEDLFSSLLCLERKRSERSGRKFALMLVDDHTPASEGAEQRFDNLTTALTSLIRETDIIGLHKQGAIAGVILTEFGSYDLEDALKCIHARVSQGLKRILYPSGENSIHIAFHVFPDEWKPAEEDHAVDLKLYPDIPIRDKKSVPQILKRGVDIVGSLAALVAFSPIFIGAGIAIKLTSKGSIFFRQKRLGQFGTVFTMYKFRSMSSKAKSDSHEQFVQQYITGKMDVPGDQGLYKLQDDPRITKVGKFMRKTSLDELPQFLNVLLGNMSLVGPRPPIPYELKSYSTWHRRRLLDAKPGITGLWQVSGRNKICFNDMVRLDLRYARIQSVWLDISLLFKTARVLFNDESAR